VIDFRYHIVSLISVFLALAVGIALGAGPLKETIGDTLTGQVEALRAEKDTLRSELESSDARLAHSSTWIDAAGPQLVDGTLSGRRVAVVALGEIDPERASAIDSSLQDAGATLTAHVTLTDVWTDAELQGMRHALAGTFAQYLSPAPADDADDATVLAQALAQGLTGADPTVPDALTESASTLLDLLDEGDQALITVAEPVVSAADAVVVISPVVDAEDAEVTPVDEDDTSVLDAQVAVLRAAQDASEGAVLADGPRADGGLTAAILADADLAERLTTVSGTDQVTGEVAVPLALNARIGGSNGHYGFAEDETVLPQAVVLTPVDRTPQAAATTDLGQAGTNG
jgi:hypothetical protein